MSDPQFKVVEASSITMEDGAEDLLNSPGMVPFSRYIEAAITGADTGPSTQEIAALPLEKRYVWRVASALKWGFADFEDWNVAVDLKPENAIASTTHLPRRRCCHAFEIAAIRHDERESKISDHSALLIEIEG